MISANYYAAQHISDDDKNDNNNNNKAPLTQIPSHAAPKVKGECSPETAK